ncbi:unnamed protein product [Ectocarpus fasciculatus]
MGRRDVHGLRCPRHLSYCRCLRQHHGNLAGIGALTAAGGCGWCYGQDEEVWSGTESVCMGRLGRHGVHHYCSGNVLRRRQAKTYFGRSSCHGWNELLFDVRVHRAGGRCHPGNQDCPHEGTTGLACESKETNPTTDGHLRGGRRPLQHLGGGARADGRRPEHPYHSLHGICVAGDNGFSRDGSLHQATWGEGAPSLRRLPGQTSSVGYPAVSSLGSITKSFLSPRATTAFEGESDEKKRWVKKEDCPIAVGSNRGALSKKVIPMVSELLE